jgi:hypothetical protein
MSKQDIEAATIYFFSPMLILIWNARLLQELIFRPTAPARAKILEQSFMPDYIR